MVGRNRGVLTASIVLAAAAALLPAPAGAAPATQGPVEYIICVYEQRDPAACPPPVGDIPPAGGIPGPGAIPRPGNAPDGCEFADTYPLGVLCVISAEPHPGKKHKAGITYLSEVPGASIVRDTLEECYYDNPDPDKVARAQCIVLRIVRAVVPD